MKKYVPKTILGILLVCILAMGFQFIKNDIGISSSKLEADVRSSQKIRDDWMVDGTVSDTMAAFISYPKDRNAHVYSVYINRPGLSFGYFFRGGGSLSGIENGIMECTAAGYKERAFISLNKQKINHLEIDDGNLIKTIDIDSSKPFAIVLPVNAGNLTFYDVDGTVIDFWNNSL